MRRLLLLALAVVSTPAFANYKSEYASYRQALETGDIVGARRHGEAAWRDAEREIGDSRDTARLAFNYAELVVIDSPKMAREPYEHAQAIAKKIETGLNSEDIAAGLAYAISADASDDKLARRQLEAALEARRTAKLPASTVSGYGWLSLSRAALAGKNFERAIVFADRSVADATEASKYEKRLMRTALVIDGIAHVASPVARQRDYIRAATLFDRSFPLFPPQKDIDNFDRLLALGLSWSATIRAVAATNDLAEVKKSTFHDSPNLSDDVRWTTPQVGCAEINWKVQPSPKYPERARNRQQIGAILVGYDVAGDRIDRAIILADQTNSEFGDVTIEAMKHWIAASPVEEACSKNLLKIALFYLK